MKKILVYISSICLLLLVLFFGRAMITAQEEATSTTSPVANTEQDTRQPLYIFNWGSYIDPDLIAKFEEETNYRVVYETFDSNEAMEAKLRQGGTTYDLVFPSESSVPKLIEQQLLLPLDYSKLEGTQHLSSFLLDKRFDPGNQYTLPYFWGTIGIMVNTTQVDVNEITSWNDLWKPQWENSILLIDGNRETLGMALQALGYSQNSTNPTELAAAQQKLMELTPNIRALLREEIKSLMIQGEAPIGIGYSGDAAFVISENPDIAYVLPNDGGAVWTDNFAIPKTAVNIDGAYAFINFMLRPENAAQNAEYVGYATPNEAAKALLPEEIANDPATYPSVEEIEHVEPYEYLGKEWIEYYQDLFLVFKMGL